jgi:tetratricopeptide (TPR) repeat protein
LFVAAFLVAPTLAQDTTVPRSPAVVDPVEATAKSNDSAASAKSPNRSALEHASQLCRDGDYPAAAKVVEEVEARLGAADPFVYELRGTVLSLQKDYAGAEMEFRRMQERAPASHVARFNIAETVFLQARYDEAERDFAALEATKREPDPALADLCRFKRVVCRLALGNVEEAETLLPRSEKAPSSPAVQYSRAAIRFARNYQARAVETIQQARKEFPEGVENLFVDSFIELRWGHRDEQGKFAFAASPGKDR